MNPVECITNNTITILNRYYLLQQSVCGRLTRYSVTTVSIDFYAVSDKAARHFGFEPRVSREEAMERTARWAQLEYNSGGSSTTNRAGGGDDSTGTIDRQHQYFARKTGGPSKHPELGMLYLVHWIYGLLLMAVGVWMFVFPDEVGRVI
jgi:hypothetical protein